ncbi:MAG: macrolide export ATP-binding/permease MacB [Bacteroidetes bacterium]|nr:MAG: macrolide export ATP-binding/permease MacB [Bacteroidota bacterium]
MLRNYFKIAFRNMLKYKFISFINLFGLTVGLTCCLLIATYIINELSYDKYHKNAKNIYRITRLFRNPETGDKFLNLGTIAPAFGPYLINDFKDIKVMTRMIDYSPMPIKYEEKKFNERDAYFADEHLFDVFDVDMVKGNPALALKDPYCVMLSENIAKKYFGSDDPMNKVIRMNNQTNLKVTGVYKAFPANSHMHPALLVSFNTLKDSVVYGEENLRTSFSNNSFFTYILVPDHFDPKKMEAQFPNFLDKYMTGQNGPGKFKPSQGTTLNLQKLTDIHLRSHLDYEAEENGDINRVYIFSAIAFFILLIACINYMNLSTARSALRAREIGIRKAIGAERKEIITQFLSESVLVTWLSMVLAFGFTWLILPWLNKVSGQNLHITTLASPGVIVTILLVPFVVGLVSGIYPALFMSSFQPVKVLKGLFKAGGANISFRKVLVTIQFFISIILIICTSIVFSQLRYMQKKSLGYDKDHIVTMGYSAALTPMYNSFRNDMLANSAIKSVAVSSRIPTGRLLDNMGTKINRGDSMTPVNIDLKMVMADYDFMKTYGFKIVKGRVISREYGTDTTGYMINETAVRDLGFKSNDDAVGKDLEYGGTKGKIVGVFNDFHFESMHQAIAPMILLLSPQGGYYNYLSVKIAGSNISGALETIRNTWNKYLPDYPFEYKFLDEDYGKLYTSEKRQEFLFTMFACIAIFIACLGLFGLSAFAITQRIKEIGVRKVLGASTPNLVGLLSKDFMILVAISALFAFPTAWFAMHKWLQDFAYRTSISIWVFVFAAVLAAIVALATISFHAIKAAIANPVKALRSE